MNSQSSIVRIAWLLAVCLAAVAPCLAADTVALPDSLSTFEGIPIAFLAATLTTNDVPGSANGTNTQLTVVSVSTVSAQGGSIYLADGAPVWTNRFNGPSDSTDVPVGIGVDSGGNVYVTGFANSATSGDDFATIKYLLNGTPARTNRYSSAGDNFDGPTALAADPAGNVYVTGSAFSAANSDDYLTIKYLTNGTAAWTNRYNGSGSDSDTANAIAVDKGGNVYVTGSAFTSAGTYDFVTIKYRANGTGVWTNRHNGPGDDYDYATAIAVDSVSNVYVTGYTYSLANSDDYTTIKYLPNGTPAWTNRYNGPGNEFDDPIAIAVDTNGVYVTGYSFNATTGDDYLTIKYLTNGTPVWTNRYSGPGNNGDYPSGLALDSAGNVYVTGHSYSGVNADYATIKYRADGTPVWTNRYNGPGNGADFASALAVDGSGNVYVTGSSSNPFDTDFATIKYLTNGVASWTNRYNGEFNDSDGATALAVDGAGNVFVTGSSTGSSGFEDYVTIRYGTALQVTYSPVPNFVGTDSFDYVVRDSVGQLATGTVSVAVSGRPPQITAEPQDLEVVIGEPVSLAVAASGSQPLAFQWRRDGQILTGATSPVFNFTNAQPAQSGGYSVVITNGYGSVTSRVAAVTVLSTSGPQVPIVWVNQMGGTNHDYLASLTSDSGGNIYVSGSFVGNLSIGNTNLVGPPPDDIYGSSPAVSYVAKFDRNGAFQWAVQMPTNFSPYQMEVGPGGSLHLLGVFDGTLSIGTSNLVANNPFDLALVKLGPQTEFLWARQFSSLVFDAPDSLAIDSSGNVFFAGVNLVLTKLSSSGQVLWSVSSATGGAFNGGDLKADASGNVYWAAKFDTAAQLGINNLVALTNDFDSEGAFLARISSGGQVLWAKSVGPSATDNPLALAVDTDQSCYLAGTFEQRATFGGFILQAAGTGGSFDFPEDIFLAHYATNGQPVWARRYGDQGPDLASALATDGAGRFYLAGGFTRKIVLGNTTLVADTAGFVGEFNRNGDFLWANQVGDTIDEDFSQNLAADSLGGVYFAEEFFNPVVIGSTPLTPRGPLDPFSEYHNDVFLVRLEGGPALRIDRAAGSVNLSWPTNWFGLVLQAAPTLDSTNTWQTLTNLPGVNGLDYRITLPLTGDTRFFRLRGAP